MREWMMEERKTDKKAKRCGSVKHKISIRRIAQRV